MDDKDQPITGSTEEEEFQRVVVEHSDLIYKDDTDEHQEEPFDVEKEEDEPHVLVQEEEEEQGATHVVEPIEDDEEEPEVINQETVETRVVVDETYYEDEKDEKQQYADEEENECIDNRQQREGQSIVDEDTVVNGHCTELEASGEGTAIVDDEEESKNLEEALESGVLSSDAFRQELQDIVIEQLIMCGDGGKREPLTDLFTVQQRFGSGNHTCLVHVVPICDVHGTDCLNYTKGEKAFRCKLASLYRLIDLFGWVSGGFHDNITACFTDEADHLLVVPRGMMFSEVTASSLIKMDAEGSVVDYGTTKLGIDMDAFRLACSIRTARNELRCVIHLNSPAALALSVLKCGLLALCPEAMMLGEVSCFEFSESMYDEQEYIKMAKALGPVSKVLVLRNYGILVCAESIEESFILASYAMTAVDMQLSLVQIGLDNLHVPSREACQRLYDAENQPPATLGLRNAWKYGQREFEAMMRQLDSAGYCTDYVYHETTTSRLPRADRTYSSDAGFAPSIINNSGYLSTSTDRDLYKFSRPASRVEIRGVSPSPYSRDAKYDARGVSPSPYHRDEPPSLSGRSTPNPKIARWLSESPAPPRSVTPARTESANPFVPRSINPIELREKVKEIRKDYYADKVTAGPQSRILDGITWDEAKVTKISAAEVQANGGSVSDNVVLCASKGIIQREHQHAVKGYKKYEPPNPFNSMLDEDIDKYKQDVGERSRDDDNIGQTDIVTKHGDHIECSGDD